MLRYIGHLVLVGALLLGSLPQLLAAPPPAPAPALAQITTLPGDSMNLKVVDHIHAHYVVVQVHPPVHNWFCGQFTNLPTDEQTVVGLSLAGMYSIYLIQLREYISRAIKQIIL